MHNRDKYPEIWAVKEAAENEIAPLLAARKVHTDAMRDVQKQIDSLVKQKCELNEKACCDMDKLRELRDTISRTARAMGAVVAVGG